MALSIIPRRVQFTAPATTEPTVVPNVGTDVYAGLEVEGRTLSVETEEVLIEDGQTTQTKYIINWEFFIQGEAPLASARTNKPSTAAYVKSRCLIFGAAGTLSLALNNVYIWASPDYSGGKVRTKINMKKEFIQPPDTTDSPLITFDI